MDETEALEESTFSLDISPDALIRQLESELEQTHRERRRLLLAVQQQADTIKMQEEVIADLQRKPKHEGRVTKNGKKKAHH